MGTTAAELSNPLPSAKRAMEKLALAEAEKARDALRQKEKADADKKALIDQLSKPSGISEEEALKRAAAIIERALKNGLTEVEVSASPMPCAPTTAALSTTIWSPAGRTR